MSRSRLHGGGAHLGAARQGTPALEPDGVADRRGGACCSSSRRKRSSLQPSGPLGERPAQGGRVVLPGSEIDDLVHPGGGECAAPLLPPLLRQRPQPAAHLAFAGIHQPPRAGLRILQFEPARVRQLAFARVLDRHRDDIVPHARAGAAAAPSPRARKSESTTTMLRCSQQFGGVVQRGGEVGPPARRAERRRGRGSPGARGGGPSPAGSPAPPGRRTAARPPGRWCWPRRAPAPRPPPPPAPALGRGVPNRVEPDWSTTRSSVSSRSSMKVLTKGWPSRAETFQSMARKSSPCSYWRTSANSIPWPRNTERYSPANRDDTSPRVRSSMALTCFRISGEMAGMGVGVQGRVPRTGVRAAPVPVPGTRDPVAVHGTGTASRIRVTT